MLNSSKAAPESALQYQLGFTAGTIAKEWLLAGCSTKAGYIADDIADNLLVKSQKHGGISKGDIVGGNCMHPSCLDASLSRSLAAMNIGTVSPFHVQLSPDGAVSVQM